MPHGNDCGGSWFGGLFIFGRNAKNVDVAPWRYSRGRWSVVDGASPNSDLYSQAKGVALTANHRPQTRDKLLVSRTPKRYSKH